MRDLGKTDTRFTWRLLELEGVLIIYFDDVIFCLVFLFIIIVDWHIIICFFAIVLITTDVIYFTLFFILSLLHI